MGQKVNPIGFRLGVNRDWRSRWYASPQELPQFLHSDIEIRAYVKKKLQFAAVAKIVIERAWNSIRVTIHTARPGVPDALVGAHGLAVDAVGVNLEQHGNAVPGAAGLYRFKLGTGL